MQLRVNRVLHLFRPGRPAEPEEVSEPSQLRLLSGVDPVGVDHDARPPGLAEGD
jgi:hypothetical protein